MRPRRLELEGFASFRDRVELVFDDTDLFVLTGPTGAGKSTLIDAITFALYGSIPRYDDRRLVAPVISQGMAEARVRLDFFIGADSFTAVRVVRRTRTGATTKEARLEDSEGRVLASSADDLTAEVTRRIGLTFDHFIKCVVLPQGDFAEFLHARPAIRQDMLIELLDLDIYRRIAKAAGRRQKEAEERARFVSGRLDTELKEATPAALEQAQGRVASLESLLAHIDQAQPELERLQLAVGAAQRAAGQAEARAAVLAAVRIPPGMADLGQRIAEAVAATSAAEKALEKAVAQRDTAERLRAELPGEAELRAWLESHKRREKLTAELGKATAARERAATTAAAAAREEQAAAARQEQAREAWERSRQEHMAFHLAEGLHIREPCPVCQQQVNRLPDHEPPPDAQRLKEARSRAGEALQAAQEASHAAARELARREEAVAGVEAQLAGVAEELEGRPARPQIEEQLGKIATAEQAVARAREGERQARAAQHSARSAAAALAADQEAAWREFDGARDRCAGQVAPAPPPGVATAATAGAAGPAPAGPAAESQTLPVADRSDLAGSWAKLVGWAQQRARHEQAEAGAQHQTAREARDRFDTLQEELRTACAELAVDAARRDPRDAAVDARARAAASAQRLEADIARAAELRRELEAAQQQARVAGHLHRYLDAKHFEAWLLNRALQRLVAGANLILGDLSSGAYSLALDEANNTFQVIDHRNADEERPAKTLSGGETFLASLSLALALSEHVAELAARGAARLEALFLDEGFGTLDADTLETVATALEELGSRGRMVGLITHVRALAERMPVRYEVRKVASTSTVEKVVA